MHQQQKAVTSRELFQRIALGSPCSGEDEYNAEISRCWPALNALFLDSKAPIYNRVKNIVRLEVDAIYEPAIPGGHQGTVVFDVLLELGNVNPKAPADVVKPLLQRELKRLCAPDAQQARIAEMSKTQGKDAANASQLLTPLNMAGDIIVGGIGGTLADLFAKTPQERARAEEILRLMNPTNLKDLVANVNALLPPSALKLPEPKPLPPPVKPKVCTCPSGTSDAGVQCRRNVTRARERSTCKSYNGNEERARNGLFATCPSGWIPLGVGGRDPYRCRNTAQPSCKEYNTRGGPCPSGYMMLNDITCWRLENKICA
ncbi:hypothetical protein T492DRAFT_890011 [Pavlovales sp. CCMP2436]|nr:hypothetical protein T492DRAFT_890011 [Pavlovales sp. CCMP2436]